MSGETPQRFTINERLLYHNFLMRRLHSIGVLESGWIEHKSLPGSLAAGNMSVALVANLNGEHQRDFIVSTSV
jgi:hypothetical protein